MATRPAHGWQITNHAVARYRERGVLCTERQACDSGIRQAISDQLDFFASLYLRGGIRLIRCGPDWRISKKFKNVCEHPTHTFVVVDGVVVTTLGFMMMPTEAAQMHYARMAREHRRERYYQAVARRDFQQTSRT